VERFAPAIDLYPMHFCVHQEKSGNALICSNDGLVEFDSERWRLTRMPNGEIVRSLAIAQDGTIYVGGYNLFGLMRRNAAGVLEFEDLTPSFRDFVGTREFADIWEVLIAPEGVYFRALYDVFLWNPATRKATHINHAGRFGWISQLDGRTTLQFRGEGVKAWDGAKWELLSGGARFKVLLQVWLPRRDGSALVIDDAGLWWSVDREGRASAVVPPQGVVPNTVYVNGVELPEGGIALSTASGELMFIDAALKGVHRVGLENGFVAGMCAQNGGGVLATVQGALYRVGWPARWTVLGQEHGVSGSFSSLVEWNGDLHLLTSAGVFRSSRSQGEIKFKQLPLKADVPQHLLPLDARRALLATSRQVSLIEDGRIRALTPETIYPREFVRSRFHPGRVFLFTEHGLRMIDLRKGFEFSKPLPNRDGVLISTLVEVSETEVWTGTQRHGVLRFKLSAAGELVDVAELGESSGLKTGQLAETYVGEVGARDAAGRPDWVVSTRRGIFRWAGTRFEPESLSGLSAVRREDEAFAFVNRANGDLWAYGNTRILQRVAGSSRWLKQEIRPLMRGALVQHVELSGDQLAFVTSDGVLIHHPDARDTQPLTDDSPSPYPLSMNAVMLEQGGKTQVLPLNPAEPVRIPEGEFSIRFDFAMPQYVREGIKRYQGRMEGEEDKMSDWGLPSRYTYYSLKAGDYALHVRAMDGEGRVASLVPYRFTVVPPWYLRNAAKALYVAGAMLLAMIMVLAYIRLRTARWQRANLALEEGIASRTRELADANRRLDMMAHMDGLTGIANRRSLDAYLPAVWTQCGEQRRPVSVLVIDADHFKKYNDTHGHVAGDDLLKSLTRHLLNQLRRAEDFLARYGGEEFVVVLPGADATVAAAMAESMRKSIAESPLGITVSIGTCTAIPDGSPPEALVARADRALYEAKNAGRNQVKVCDDC
jgi:diguanylate cyclase (GGDEF)-like protein